MAGYQRCISLALACLLLCHNSLAIDSTACTAWSSGDRGGPHALFLKDHILPKGTPDNPDQSFWNMFLEQKDLNRNIQSFLISNDIRDVKAVCRDSGGQQFTGISNRFGSNGRADLCISRRPFTFFNVYKANNGRPRRVTKEYKHLILACARVNNICKPVHFEINYNDEEPNVKDKGCEGGRP